MGLRPCVDGPLRCHGVRFLQGIHQRHQSFQHPDVIATTRHAATVYSVQLALNLIWTPLFFGLKKPVVATVDILALLATNVYLTYLWSSVDQVSTYCQIPYLGWLGFATYLCAGIGYVNNWDLKGKEPKSE